MVLFRFVCLVYGKSSVSVLCVVIMWVVVGGGLIAVCRCGSVCKQIKVHNVAAVRLSEPVGRQCVH